MVSSLIGAPMVCAQVIIGQSLLMSACHSNVNDLQQEQILEGMKHGSSS
jgi:hypothetical protein